MYPESLLFRENVFNFVQYFFCLMHCMCILNHCILRKKKRNSIVLIVENKTPNMSSYLNNLTFRCCKRTTFILQTCFISLSFSLFCLLCAGGYFPFIPHPTLAESVFVGVDVRRCGRGVCLCPSLMF